MLNTYLNQLSEWENELTEKLWKINMLLFLLQSKTDLSKQNIFSQTSAILREYLLRKTFLIVSWLARPCVLVRSVSGTPLSGLWSPGFPMTQGFPGWIELIARLALWVPIIIDLKNLFFKLGKECLFVCFCLKLFPVSCLCPLYKVKGTVPKY